jgi:hypothetical protein
MSSPVSYDLQGQGGGVVIDASDPGNGTATKTGNFRWVQCVTDCTFTTVTSSNILQPGDGLATSIPAGVGFGGRFTTVTLSSGTAILYYL